MGIAGLLKHLRSITKRVHIREYNGLKAAVDLHCWIHKGSIGCCRELSEGIATTAFVDYCMQMLKLLVAHGITPIVGKCFVDFNQCGVRRIFKWFIPFAGYFMIISL